MHWMLDLLHSCVALGARLTASNVRALPEGDLEEFTAEWLKCSVLRGGLEEGAHRTSLNTPAVARHGRKNSKFVSKHWQI